MVDEIKASMPRKPSVVVLSVGGGGLLCGVLKGLHNVGWGDVPVVAMETEGANCFAASIEAEQLATIPAITRLVKDLRISQVQVKKVHAFYCTFDRISVFLYVGRVQTSCGLPPAHFYSIFLPEDTSIVNF